MCVWLGRTIIIMWDKKDIFFRVCYVLKKKNNREALFFLLPTNTRTYITSLSLSLCFGQRIKSTPPHTQRRHTLSFLRHHQSHKPIMIPHMHCILFFWNCHVSKNIFRISLSLSPTQKKDRTTHTHKEQRREIIFWERDFNYGERWLSGVEGFDKRWEQRVEAETMVRIFEFFNYSLFYQITHHKNTYNEDILTLIRRYTHTHNHRLKMSEVERAKAVARAREKRMIRVSSFSVPITPVGKRFSSENVRAIRHVFDRFYFGTSF